jgi:hypothetical protein
VPFGLNGIALILGMTKGHQDGEQDYSKGDSYSNHIAMIGDVPAAVKAVQ